MDSLNQNIMLKTTFFPIPEAGRRTDNVKKKQGEKEMVYCFLKTVPVKRKFLIQRNFPHKNKDNNIFL